MNKKFLPILAGLIVLGLALVSFTPAYTKNGTDSIESSVTTEKATVTRIDAQKAKDIMDTTEGYVILDVRTVGEYESGHISGAILIPDYELKDKAAMMLDDKDQVILVYCRSGNRSAGAARNLVSLGYTNVYDFGGVISWPYGLVK